MRRAIDRRLNIAAPEQPEPGAEVVFNDAWGEPIQRFAFDKLGLPADIAAILAEAFRHHYAGMEPNGRVGAWKRIKVFAAFLREHQIEDASELTTALVGRYLIWLDRQTTRAGQPWTLRVKAQTVGILGVLVNWTKRNRPASLPARIDLPTNPYPRSRETSRPRPRLDEPVLKVLLSYCYEEIDLAWARFEEGRAMLAGDRSDAAPGELAAVVRAVAAVENGLLPSAQSVLAAGAGLHRVQSAGRSSRDRGLSASDHGRVGGFLPGACGAARRQSRALADAATRLPRRSSVGGGDGCRGLVQASGRRQNQTRPAPGVRYAPTLCRAESDHQTDRHDGAAGRAGRPARSRPPLPEQERKAQGGRFLADGNLARGDPAPGRARQRQDRGLEPGQSRPAPRSSAGTWSPSCCAARSRWSTSAPRAATSWRSRAC